MPYALAVDNSSGAKLLFCPVQTGENLFQFITSLHERIDHISSKQIGPRDEITHCSNCRASMAFASISTHAGMDGIAHCAKADQRIVLRAQSLIGDVVQVCTDDLRLRADSRTSLPTRLIKAAFQPAATAPKGVPCVAEQGDGPGAGKASRRKREITGVRKSATKGALCEPGRIPGGEESFLALSKSVHAFLARSQAAIAMVQLSDLTGEVQQVNLPGTDTEYPNWRRRLSMALEEIKNNPDVAAVIEIMRRERPELNGPRGCGRCGQRGQSASGLMF